MSRLDESRLRPPAPVVELAATLAAAGYPTWCVGGAVRDALLGVIHQDWDLATAATPTQMRRLFRRTVPIGIEFGTVGILDSTGRMHEVTTFRRDVQTDGRHAVVEFGASLDEDLARRDFTINAIAFDPLRQVIHDPWDGRGDLQRGVVRAVGVPGERMREDRLRALRGIRFASRFHFVLDNATWEAICESAPHLTRLSPERVKQELDKTMEQLRHPSAAFRLWRESGAFASVVPALSHVSDSTLLAVDRLPRPGVATRPLRRALRTAVLFSECDLRTAESAMRALRASNHETSVVRSLVERWSLAGPELSASLRAGRVPPDSRLRRIAADIGRVRVNGFLRFAAAHWGGDEAISASNVRVLFRRLMHIAFHDPIELADLALDGDDLRQNGFKPGPQIGQVLHALLDAVVDDPSINTREQLLTMAKNHHWPEPESGPGSGRSRLS